MTIEPIRPRRARDLTPDVPIVDESGEVTYQNVVTNEWGYQRTEENDRRALRDRFAESRILSKFFPTGRPRAGRRRLPYASEWAVRFVRIEAVLLGRWEQDRKNGVPGTKPSKIDIGAALAERDCHFHPERWSAEYLRDGELAPAFEKQAGHRVWVTVKPLLNAVKKTV